MGTRPTALRSGPRKSSRNFKSVEATIIPRQGQQQTEILQRIELSLRKEELEEKQAAQENQEIEQGCWRLYPASGRRPPKTKTGR